MQFAGQSLFGVAATSYEAARRAARLARVRIRGVARDPGCASRACRGQLRAAHAASCAAAIRKVALAQAPHRLRGSLTIGGQEHFYLEGQVAVAIPQEDGTMLVHSSTQHPTEVQHAVAHALGIPFHRVTVQCRRMGGGFGGKESQPAQFACAAAVLARRGRGAP